MYRASNLSSFLVYLLAAVYYAVVAYVYEFQLNEETMFLAMDANEYKEVGQWLIGESETVNTATRPLLYPALIALPYHIAGVYGIWLIQAAAWLLSVYFIFSAGFHWMRRYWLALIPVLLFAINLSAIAITFHGLTETFTILCLTLILWLLAKYDGAYGNPSFGSSLLILFVALTLIKPVFYYPALIGFLCFAVFYFKAYTANWKVCIVPIIALGLLLGQMMLVKVRHDHFAVSTISEKTFVEYFFSQGLSSIEVLDFEVAKQEALSMASDERSAYFKDHFRAYWKLFNQNIEKNMKGEPVYMDYTSKLKIAPYDAFVFAYNGRMYKIHTWFFCLMGLFGIYYLLRRNWSNFLVLFIAGGLFAYYLFATGISFWQGDRLILPVIAIWPLLYIYLLYLVSQELGGWIEARKKRRLEH